MIISVPGSPWWGCTVRLLLDEEEEPGPGALDHAALGGGPAAAGEPDLHLTRPLLQLLQLLLLLLHVAIDGA